MSNHGARQLDYVPATITALEEVICFASFIAIRITTRSVKPLQLFSSILDLGSCDCSIRFFMEYESLLTNTNPSLFEIQVVKAAQGRVPVFLDGGVRRGTDVFKALALGASGVFVSND